jgi:hypothetical protein
VIPYGRLLQFGQKHEFGGFHFGDFGVFREIKFTDHKMKYRRNLYIIWVCELFNVFVRTSEVRYALSGESGAGCVCWLRELKLVVSAAYACFCCARRQVQLLKYSVCYAREAVAVVHEGVGSKAQQAK